MTILKSRYIRLSLIWLLFIVLPGFRASAEDKIYPDKPDPPRLLNDFAHVLNNNEAAQLEQKLDDFDRNTSTQITVVTIKNLGGYDVEEYSVQVFNRWGIGQNGKNNGVLLLVSMDDHKAWITVGKGLEGVLTDAKSGQIFRNELQPNFRQGKYYDGLSRSADAIIAVTKGEYTADSRNRAQQDQHVPLKAIIVFVVFIIIVLRIFRGGGGGGNDRDGGYMSGRGFRNFATGWFIGSLLGGGNRGDGWGGGGSDWGGGGGGGFGGFGGGSTGGGGAGGSW